MSNERDRELSDWLDAYQLDDVDPALLETIVARASATPQRDLSQKTWFFGWSWSAHAATFAMLALIGFWGGTNSLSSSVSETRTSVISDQSYFDKIIFGPQTWKEVSL